MLLGHDDEDCDFSVPANLVRDWRAVGGAIRVSTAAVRFSPSRVERLFRSQAVSIATDEIQSVSVEPPRRSAFFAGGLRRRLVLRTRSAEFVFIVSDPDHIRDELGRRLDAAR